MLTNATERQIQHYAVTEAVSPALPSARIIAQIVALTPGTRLGVYEVTAPIGEGGMGQVYRATRHEAGSRGRDQDPAGRVRG